MLEILLGVLACWRITAWLVYEDSADWVRDRAKVYITDEADVPKHYWGRVLTCFWCTATFVGSVVACILLFGPIELALFLLLPFAVSGGAILLNHSSRTFLRRE